MTPMPEGFFFHPIMPEDLRKTWKLIRYGLLRAVPPTAGANLNAMRHLLINLLLGKAQAWLLYAKADARLHSMALTYINNDPMTGSRYLIIYALYNYSKIGEDLWSVIHDRIRAFAVKEGAERMIAFSNVPKIIEVCTSRGFSADFTLLSEELNG